MQRTEHFVRDYGFSEPEWRRCLPEALGGRDAHLGADRAEVVIGTGRLVLRWAALPARRIALLKLPRLAVHFEFKGVDEAARAAFLAGFDRVMLRGGG